MKILLSVLLLVSPSVFSHGHSHGGVACAGHGFANSLGTALGIAPAAVSIFWNGGEILNHALAIFGIGEHEHEHVEHSWSHNTAQIVHFAELALHSVNLVTSGLDIADHQIQSKKFALLLTAANFAGAFAQAHTMMDRGMSSTGLAMSPFSLLDLVGHLSSAFSSVKPLFT